MDLVDAPRDLSRNPLFQVMFNLLNVPGRRDLGTAALRMVPFAVEPGIAQQDLALYAYEVDDGLRFRLEYNTDLFDAATAERMMGHLETLLAAAVADPGRPAGGLAVLTPAELAGSTSGTTPPPRRLVRRDADGGRRLPTPPPTLVELIAHQVATNPDRPGRDVRGDHAHVRPVQRPGQPAGAPAPPGRVGPDVTVAVCLHRSHELPVTLVGVLKAGGAYVPVDPDYPIERQRYVLSTAAPRSWSPRRAWPTGSPGTPARWCAPTRGATGPDTDPEPLAGPDDLAYVIYTSGSTGHPKGVRVTHGAIVNILAAMRERPGLTSDGTMLAMASFAFDMSVPELFLPLVVGARMLMVGRDVAYDAPRLAELLAAEGVTLAQGTPATWRLLIESGWTGMPGLTAVCGGEAVSAPLARQLAERVGALWNLYGPTEAAVWCTWNASNPTSRTSASAARSATCASTCSTRNCARSPWACWVSCSSAARGWRGTTTATRPHRAAVRAGPVPPAAGSTAPGTSAAGWPTATSSSSAAATLQVKVRGFRIELGEIEAVLRRHP